MWQFQVHSFEPDLIPQLIAGCQRVQVVHDTVQGINCLLPSIDHGLHLVFGCLVGCGGHHQGGEGQFVSQKDLVG